MTGRSEWDCLSYGVSTQRAVNSASSGSESCLSSLHPYQQFQRVSLAVQMSSLGAAATAARGVWACWRQPVACAWVGEMYYQCKLKVWGCRNSARTKQPQSRRISMLWWAQTAMLCWTQTSWTQVIRAWWFHWARGSCPKALQWFLKWLTCVCSWWTLKQWIILVNEVLWSSVCSHL